MIVKREKATDIKKKLVFPLSPAFVYAKNSNTHANSPQRLENLVDFCHQKNIPFKDEEERFYKVNAIK